MLDSTTGELFAEQLEKRARGLACQEDLHGWQEAQRTDEGEAAAPAVEGAGGAAGTVIELREWLDRNALGEYAEVLEGAEAPRSFENA